MPLTLSSQDRSRLSALQVTLLSPLEHRSVNEWCRQLLRRSQDLFQADRSGIWLPQKDGLFHLSETLEEKYLQRFEEGISHAEPRALRFDERRVDTSHQVRRSRNLFVWTIPMLAQMSGTRPEDSTLYHEAVEQAGIAHSVVINPSLPWGEAILGISHSNPDDDPFGEEAAVELGKLVIPAFEAGIELLSRLEDRREDLSSDAESYDLGGRILLRPVRGSWVSQLPDLG